MRPSILIVCAIVLTCSCLTPRLWRGAVYSPVEVRGVTLARGPDEHDRLVFRATGILDLTDGYNDAELPRDDPAESSPTATELPRLRASFLCDFVPAKPPPVDRRVRDLEAGGLGPPPSADDRYGIVVPDEWSTSRPNELEIYRARTEPARWVRVATLEVGPTASSWASPGQRRARYVFLSVGTLLVDTALVLAVVLIAALVAAHEAWG